LANARRTKERQRGSWLSVDACGSGELLLSHSGQHQSQADQHGKTDNGHQRVLADGTSAVVVWRSWASHRWRLKSGKSHPAA